MIGAVARGPLHLLAESLDVGNEIDASVVFADIIFAKRIDIGREIHADDDSALLHQPVGLRLLLVAPAGAIRNQHHHAFDVAVRQEDMPRRNEPGFEALRGFLGGNGRGRQRERACGCEEISSDHFLTTPFNPPPIRRVASINAIIGLPPPDTAR